MGSPFKAKARMNPEWQAKMESAIFQCKDIDEITSFRPALQWLIIRLSRVGIPYKIFNLGAGVSRITTKTDKCPCCGEAL